MIIIRVNFFFFLLFVRAHATSFGMIWQPKTSSFYSGGDDGKYTKTKIRIHIFMIRVAYYYYFYTFIISYGQKNRCPMVLSDRVVAGGVSRMREIENTDTETSTNGAFCYSCSATTIIVFSLDGIIALHTKQLLAVVTTKDINIIIHVEWDEWISRGFWRWQKPWHRYRRCKQYNTVRSKHIFFFFFFWFSSKLIKLTLCYDIRSHQLWVHVLLTNHHKKLYTR